MEIKKLGFGVYDPQYVQALQSERARSIKPGLLNELPEEVQIALWLSDLVFLSTEAKTILKKLRKGKFEAIDETEWLRFLEEVKEQKIGNGKKGEQKKEDLHLNLISLPVMRPPLQELLRDENGKKGALASINPLRRILEKMIARAVDPKIKNQLIDELLPLGVHVIEAVRQFGVAIVLLTEKERISDIRIHNIALSAPNERTRDGRLRDKVRGMYFEDRRLIVLGEEAIGLGYTLPSVHEFAHAYDHAFSETHRRMHHLSTQLWNLFAKSRKQPISEYAELQPAEYFAESMEAYFIPSKRKELQKHDPQMLEYLSTLFTL